MSYLGVGQALSDLVILIQRHIVRKRELLRLLPQPLGLAQQLTNENRVLRAFSNEGQVLPDRPAPGSSACQPTGTSPKFGFIDQVWTQCYLFDSS